jgi:hypothetical protein
MHFPRIWCNMYVRTPQFKFPVTNIGDPDRGSENWLGISLNYKNLPFPFRTVFCSVLWLLELYVITTICTAYRNIRSTERCLCYGHLLMITLLVAIVDIATSGCVLAFNSMVQILQGNDKRYLQNMKRSKHALCFRIAIFWGMSPCDRSPTFQRSVLPPSSGLKNKLRKEKKAISVCFLLGACLVHSPALQIGCFLQNLGEMLL